MSASQAAGGPGPGAAHERRLERAVGRLLSLGTLAGVVLLAIGVAGMLAAGLAPLTTVAPALDLARLAADLAALRPEGFLWLGVAVIIATPSARVATALVGYGLEGDRRMVGIAVAILGVIALSVAVAMATGA